MKFSKLSQLFLVSIIGLMVATLVTSCAIVTIDYVFVASSSGSGTASAGQIETYDADSETGALRVGAATVPSGGIDPISMATTADYANLYVVNQASNNVVHFSISGSGILKQKDVLTTSANPVWVAVNTAETYLYVVSGPNPSVLTAYSLSSGAIGSAAAQVTLTLPGYPTDTIVPTGVHALANNDAVFVSAYDQSAYNPGGTTTSTANPGWVFGYVVGSGGALSPSSNSPYKAGVKPSALISDPTNRFVYVTDFASNELIGYTIQGGSTLDFLINGPFKTSLATGTPSSVVNVTGSQVNATDTTPVALIVDPALGRFVYTANKLGNSISGFVLNPTTGSLKATQSGPYATGDQPSALAAVPHGNHSIQTVSP
jgi:6-phosphogluconolactonase (cycloisomerase 2 family)